MSEELEKEGWIKRTTIDEPRLSEIIEEYESLGYEVHLEPVKLEDLDKECKGVIKARLTNSRMYIYEKASDFCYLTSFKINWFF